MDCGTWRWLDLRALNFVIYLLDIWYNDYYTYIGSLNYRVLPLCIRGGELYEELENGHFNPGEYFSSGRRNSKSAGIESQSAIYGSNC